MKDEAYMKLAIALAKKGEGWVNPNPMVGAVIVKSGAYGTNNCGIGTSNCENSENDDAVIGSGYHERCGSLHAERNALANCKESPQGATLYVTLEPCCHYGKTPPCTDAIIESGISRVVIGTLDPNPLVSGKGAALLRSHNIEVTAGILEAECRALIRRFTHFITTGTPYVTMKYAMTLDGKIATHANLSQWITGSTAREHVHRERHCYHAIMAGVNTVLCDDPLLTCRLMNTSGESDAPGSCNHAQTVRNPIRIICDTHLRTPLSSQIVQTAAEVETILATCEADIAKHRPYEQAGCNILTIDEKDGHVNLNTLMHKLGEQKIDSILLEGGSTLNWSALESKIVNNIQAYIAPKLFGGVLAKTPIGGAGVASPSDAFTLTAPAITQLGNDYLLESEVAYPCSQES